MPNTTEKLTSVLQPKLLNASSILDPPTYGFQAKNVNQSLAYYTPNMTTLNHHPTSPTTLNSTLPTDQDRWMVSGVKIPSPSEESQLQMSMSEKPLNWMEFHSSPLNSMVFWVWPGTRSLSMMLTQSSSNYGTKRKYKITLSLSSWLVLQELMEALLFWEELIHNMLLDLSNITQLPLKPGGYWNPEEWNSMELLMI